MPTITSFVGEKLLESATIAEIKNQTEILLKNKDVAAAYQAAIYLKAELAKLPADKVKPVLDVYRAVSANLKVLALPLLEKDEVNNLLANNLPFVDAAFSGTLTASLSAWLALQPEADAVKTKEELLAVLPAGNPLSEKIRTILSSSSTVAPVVSLRALPMAIGRRSNPEDIAMNVGIASSPRQGGSPRNDNRVTAVTITKDELFDADEASELASHAAKVNEMGGNPLSVDGAANLADEILSLRPASRDSLQNDGGKVQSLPRTGFGDEENFKRRAQALVVSRLRDVRTTAEIREYLGRPFAVGGLGLAGEPLEKALKLIEQEYGRLHASGPSRTASQASPPMASPQPEAGMKSLAEESQGAKGQDEGKIAPSAVSEAASPPVVASHLQPEAKGGEAISTHNAMNVGIASVAPPAESAGGLPRNDTPKLDASATVKVGVESSSATVTAAPRVARPVQTSGSDKPRLDDIKHPAADIALPFGSKGQFPLGRLNVGFSNIGSGTGGSGQGGSGRGPRWQQKGNIGSGTVGAPDELKLLTLADWRSFGGGQAAINHILEKVNVLAKESLSEKMAALAAFRESELFREYVNIGRLALASNRKLAEALADAAVNPNKMTEDEFFAVAELNGKLK